MKTIQQIMVTASLASLCLACYQDKGNYDYIDYPGITIKGIEKEYGRMAYRDTLYITPDITPADGDYEYLWMINEWYEKMPEMSGMGDGFRIDTIGKEKNLAYPVELSNGDYDLILKVTDKRTGYSAVYETALSAQSVYSTGFYVLKEIDGGNTDVDLHAPDGLYPNLIKAEYGESMKGLPTSMGLIPEYCHIDPELGKYIAPRAMSICAGDDIKVFNLETFETIFTHEDLFFGEAPEETPFYLYPNLFNIAYVSSSGICFNYQNGINLPSAGKMTEPVVIKNGYRPGKYVMSSGGAFCSYLFDELNHRFIAFDFNGSVNLFNEEVGEGETFVASPNNIPADYELVFFGHNASDGVERGYALFEDARRQKHLYILEVASYDYSNPIVEIQDIAFDELNQATVLGNNENEASMIYFAYNNQVYQYGVVSKKIEPLKLEGFEGGEITYISNRYWNGSEKDEFDYLAIATYKDGKYTVYFYETIGGLPDGKPVKVLKGEGKCVKLHYNSPEMTSNDAVAVQYPFSF